MKLMFVARSLDSGGSERQLVSLAAGLTARGHDVSVLTFYAGGGYANDLREGGVAHIALEKRGRWDVLAFLRAFRRSVAVERPDILYSFLPTPNVLTALFAPRPAGMRLVWGLRASDMDPARYDWLQRVAFAMERRLSRVPDLIVANSEAGRRHALACGMPEGRLAVVCNGIDTDRFKPDVEARRLVRAELGVAEDEVLVGMAARFDPMKDHAGFVTAAGQFARRGGRGVRFLVAGQGTGPDNVALREHADAAGLDERSFLMLGERNDMPRLTAALDVAVLASLSEGFPNVLGEAMACGVPCVTTRVGDAAEILGDTGEVVVPGDPLALAQAMERLIGRVVGQGDEVRRAARRRIVSRFGREAMITASEQTLLELLRAPRNAAACAAMRPG